MLRFNRLSTILLLAALILSACQPIQLVAPGQETVAAPALVPQPHTPRPDAPTYGVRGPYAVGVRDFVIEGTKEYSRAITVSVWYPALNVAGKPEAITYHLGIPNSPTPDFTVAGRALVDALPDLANTPYPLVVYSHGGWMFRQDAVYLLEQLASHGFVVMAAVHEDNWSTILENFYRSEISRPQDISREIDFAQELTAAGGALAGLVDTEHVAVSGWSLGGQVAMEKGGARLNLVEQQANHCIAYPDDQRCAFYAEPIPEMAQLAGLAALPAGFWPDWRDPRVDALMLLEPAEGSLGAQPPTLNVPVLLIEGTEDRPGYGITGIDSVHKTGVVFEYANHFIMGNRCAAVPGMVDAGFYFACSDPVWDMDRAHDLINHFATAFLLAELKGDTEAAKALAPENVVFPGIEYETTAYGE